MVWPHPRDVILYARSSYYYDNMFIICLFSDILSDFKTCLGLKSRKIAGTFAITLRFLTSRQHLFRLWFHACSLLYVTSPQKQVADVSLILTPSVPQGRFWATRTTTLSATGPLLGHWFTGLF